MPYSQIISLMMAMVLMAGSPSDSQLAYTLPHTLALWAAKTIIYALCLYILIMRSPPESRAEAAERLQPAALLPLAADFYVLDIRDLLYSVSWIHSFPMLAELAGILLFLGYLALLWAAEWLAARRGGAVMEGLGSHVNEQLSLILPALVPYIILTVLLETATKWAPGWLRSILNSDAGPLVSLAMFTILLTVLIPPVLVRMWKCTPLPQGKSREAIEKFIRKRGTSFNNIYLWPLKGGKACTAAVVGIIPGFRYMLLTPALISYLQPEETEAVLSHETEHVLRKHILWYVFFLACYAIVIYRLMDPLWTWILSQKSFLSVLLLLQDTPRPVISLAAVLPMVILILLYFRFLMGWFMRNFERQADLSVFRTQGHPWHMVAALEKVAILSGGTREKPSWHHYSIAQRIDFLARAAGNPGLVKQHNIILNRGRAVFMAAVLILSLTPGMMPIERWKENAQANMARAYMDQILNRGSRNASWYLMLGNLFARQHDYDRAVHAYRKALELEPDNPDALNNLAWLHATARDSKFFQPELALMYAARAASAKPLNYILDTLAEAFFINGYVDMAIKTEKEALAKTESGKGYYRKQLQRFIKNAADGQNASSGSHPLGSGSGN